MSAMDLSAIRIGERVRRDMGEIDALAQSIADVGLMHPVVVRSDGTLIVGERRIRAYQKLGRTCIPVTVVDLDRVARGEYAENTFRKAFTPSEMADIADALEPAERQAAKERQGQRTDKLPGNFLGSPAGRSLDHVARVVGKDRKPSPRHARCAMRQRPSRRSSPS